MGRAPFVGGCQGYGDSYGYEYLGGCSVTVDGNTAALMAVM